MELRRDYLGNADVETVYFGGGTPSLLTADDLSLLIDKIRKTWPVMSTAEITLEANPDDITPEKLHTWQELTINRLSIGVQSFFDDDLHRMNRVHSSAQAMQAIELSQQAGISNISIDLIYGNPALPDNRWKANVQKALMTGIPHLSCYALTVEPKTPLHNMITKGKAPPISADDQSRQFMLLMDWMETEGYEHYEISNFALPGKRSRHNSSYWQGAHYLGLGPSAHSFDGSSRQWNIANNALYIQALAKQTIPLEKEELTGTEKFNEYIMTSLRTMEGIDLSRISAQFSDDALRTVEVKSKPYMEQRLIEKKQNSMVLTKKGKLFADGIAAGLFI